jgi:hypothetical protein
MEMARKTTILNLLETIIPTGYMTEAEASVKIEYDASMSYNHFVITARVNGTVQRTGYCALLRDAITMADDYCYLLTSRMS